MDFTQQQAERYSRHIILNEIGVEGQEKLLNSKVLIVGVGGLGSPVALYLAAAGVGKIGIADADVVDLSNLQRQVLHATPDVGRNKTESAREKLQALNPDVDVVIYTQRMVAANIADLVRHYDFVIDGTDNFSGKFLINDACVLQRKPFSLGSILRFEGQAMTHTPGTACYRCLYDAPPPPDTVPSCSQAGVLGAMAGTIGTIQAMEAVKYLTGVGTLLTNRLMMFDALAMRFSELAFARNPDCPVCGKSPSITQLTDIKDYC